ncbi:DNA repair protein RecO [Candidatus Saccharibacteria bacterium]|nr:DNA repair protein RecO [Candidatus Saccharibacteria bacterium]MBQ6149590.1 DNA repair protein RecO [Candidatus Saccharibacteria bacterium]
MPKDLKTKAYVLRRTNYGEADRIINLITPVGKISAMAKGVRKPKSKLAGGIEMFSLVQVNLHFGKSDMAVLTGTKMISFYGEILKDLGRMELASEILKKVSKASDSVDSPELFEIVDQSLSSLNVGFDTNLVEAWFLLNLARVMGEEINLYRDADGNKLDANLKYSWNSYETVFYVDEKGEIDANVIKILRLLVSSKLDVVVRIKDIGAYFSLILEIAKAF